jgi:hypothetical protein
MNITLGNRRISVSDWLTKEIVYEICLYMNTHQADSLLNIVRKQKNFESALNANLKTFDIVEATFTTSEGEIRVSWSSPLIGRSQIRDELVTLAF